MHGSLLNPADIAKALVGVDAVMHFAGKSLVGESVEKPDLYHQVNVDGTRILLDQMRIAGVKKLSSHHRQLHMANLSRFQLKKTLKRPLLIHMVLPN